MNTTRQGLLLQLSALFLVAATAQAQPADRIFVNGKIVTVDEDFTIAEALAIRGDRISSVRAGWVSSIRPPTPVLIEPWL